MSGDGGGDGVSSPVALPSISPTPHQVKFCVIIVPVQIQVDSAREADGGVYHHALLVVRQRQLVESVTSVREDVDVRVETAQVRDSLAWRGGERCGSGGCDGGDGGSGCGGGRGGAAMVEKVEKKVVEVVMVACV